MAAKPNKSCDAQPLTLWRRGRVPVQLDPLNSPHPVPWNWILAAHNAALAANHFTAQHYRSAALRSPDGSCLAYSRIHLELQPQLHACEVSSILLIENLVQGTLQSIPASSPFSSTWQGGLEDGAGAISIVMPVGWNQEGDQLLARQFEGRFCSSLATDYALLWNRQSGQTQLLTPRGFEQAVLLGWSNLQPQSLLFEAGDLSQAKLPRWRLDPSGVAIPAEADEAVSFGEMVADVLTGPQTSLC